MRQQVKNIILSMKGFLSEPEGIKLYELAKIASATAPCLEIGSYCGKSALVIGEACRITGANPLISVDHHSGSDEQQPGEVYFDESLYDFSTGSFTTIQHFYVNIKNADLSSWIIPVVGESTTISQLFDKMVFSMVFIDGGHSDDQAMEDFIQWGSKIQNGGYLCVHDIFALPDEGGQGPYRMFEYAKSLPEWEFVSKVESLGILRKIDPETGCH